jgi:hypothetical protein
VSDVVDELVDEARAAKRAKAAYDRHMKRVRELLPVVRALDAKKYGPVPLEEMIGKVYDRGTISRLTAEAAGTSRKNTAPDES